MSSTLLLAYPLADAWEAALYKQLSWSNTTAFITALRPITSSIPGEIDATAQSYVARYYTSEGYDWSRWNEGDLPLTLSDVPANQQVAAYEQLLKTSRMGIICLFYSTTIHGLPASVVLSTQNDITRETILNIVAGEQPSASTEGQVALTLALEDNSPYHLESVGPYSSNTATGIYAIWERTPPTQQTQKAAKR
jgi:hypothetical protein